MGKALWSKELSLRAGGTTTHQGKNAAGGKEKESDIVKNKTEKGSSKREE